MLLYIEMSIDCQRTLTGTMLQLWVFIPLHSRQAAAAGATDQADTKQYHVAHGNAHETLVLSRVFWRAPNLMASSPPPTKHVLLTPVFRLVLQKSTP